MSTKVVVFKGSGRTPEQAKAMVEEAAAVWYDMAKIRIKILNGKVEYIDPVPERLNPILDFTTEGFPAEIVPEEWGQNITVFNRSVADTECGFGSRTTDDRGMALIPVCGSARILVHEWAHVLTREHNNNLPGNVLATDILHGHGMTFGQRMKARIQAGKGG